MKQFLSCYFVGILLFFSHFLYPADLAITKVEVCVGDKKTSISPDFAQQLGILDAYLDPQFFGQDKDPIVLPEHAVSIFALKRLEHLLKRPNLKIIEEKLADKRLRSLGKLVTFYNTAAFCALKPHQNGLDLLEILYQQIKSKFMAELVGDSIKPEVYQAMDKNHGRFKERLTAELYSRIVCPYNVPGFWKKIADLEGHTQIVRAAVLSSDKQTLATASYKGNVRLWNTQTFAGTEIPCGANHPTVLAFSPDSTLLAVSKKEQKIGVFNIQKKALEKELNGHRDVSALCFTPDGQRLVSAGWDAAVRVWDMKNFTCIQVLTGQYAYPIYSGALSPNGKIFIAGSYQKAVAWDMQTFKPIKTLKVNAGLINTIVFSLDGKMVATGSDNFEAKIWNTDNFGCEKVLNSQYGAVEAVAFSQKGRLLMMVCNMRSSMKYQVKVFDIKSEKCIETYSGSYTGHGEPQLTVDGQLLVVGSDSGPAKLLKTSFARPTITLELDEALDMPIQKVAALYKAGQKGK